jgi:competence protein ComEC
MKRSQVMTFSLVIFLLVMFIYFYHPQIVIIIIIILILLALLPQKVIPTKWSWFLILLICSGLGIFRTQLDQHSPTPQDIDYYNDWEEKIVITGMICDEPDLRPEISKYTVCVQKITTSEFEREVRGQILVNTNRYPEYQYGDLILVKGNIKTPIVFESFSYRDYLSRYGIYSVIYQAQVERLESQQGESLFSLLFNTKQTFESIINRIYAEPHGSFMRGLLLGSRTGIPEQLMEKFNLTGLTHIIAISGFNITIIIAIIMGLFSFLPRKISFYLAVIAIILFTLLVGASAAVVRASIMGIIGLIALNSGRQSNINLTILLTAAVMIIWNPRILWFDIGFQLSFLAVLGLIYVAPLIEKYFRFMPQQFGLKEALIMTISAQITAMPIIIYHFHRFSIISPLTNLLVAPAIPFAMLFGFLASLLYFINYALSLSIGFVGYLLLEYIIWIVNLTSNLPYASVDIYFVGKWMIAGYYGFLLMVIWKTKRLGEASDSPNFN